MLDFKQPEKGNFDFSDIPYLNFRDLWLSFKVSMLFLKVSDLQLKRVCFKVKMKVVYRVVHMKCYALQKVHFGKILFFPWFAALLFVLSVSFNPPMTSLILCF